MEHIGDLQLLLKPPEYLNRIGLRVSDRQRYEVIEKLGESLEWMHSRGIVVGDLSARNLLFSFVPRSRVYLIDCDSMALEGRGVESQNETPDWSIEAVFPREKLGTRYTDVYKLGLVALRLFAGEQASRDASRVRGRVPSEIQRLIERSLSPDQTDRPQPTEWLSPVRRAKAKASTKAPGQLRVAPVYGTRPVVGTHGTGQPAAVARIGQLAGGVRPGPSRSRRAPRWLVAAGVLAVILLIIAGLLGQDGDETTSRSIVGEAPAPLPETPSGMLSAEGADGEAEVPQSNVSTFPDRQMAYISWREEHPRIVVRNLDRGTERVLSGESDDELWPTWAPDAERIAYASSTDGDLEIFVRNVDGLTMHQLTTNEFSDIFPVWSYSSNLILFSSNRDGQLEIYVSDPEGRFQRRLTNSESTDIPTSWSPNGVDFAFYSDRDGDFELFIMDLYGRNLRQLTHNDSSDSNAQFSPDGSRLVFESDRDGDSEIFLIDSDGSSLEQLTHNEIRDFFPTWLPDGGRISYSSVHDGDSEIFTLAADGSNLRQETDSDFQDMHARWSPDGSLRDAKPSFFDATRVWPKDRHDSVRPAVIAYLGAAFIAPGWISCGEDEICLVGSGETVYVLFTSPLQLSVEIPADVEDPVAALLALGFPISTIEGLLSTDTT